MGWIETSAFQTRRVTLGCSMILSVLTSMRYNLRNLEMRQDMGGCTGGHHHNGMNLLDIRRWCPSL
jgi:hypothetical protein